MFSRNDISIWSILKKCIGMELSKIAMPVMFNEPLSFLQRLAEYMEHTYLLQQANASTDSVERMKCVAAFAVSAVASQWERTGKPFNPLLGETYELIRVQSTPPPTQSPPTPPPASPPPPSPSPPPPTAPSPSLCSLCRDDLGFRWVSEQVSHHPPVSAFHAEGLKEDFLFHGSIYPKLKFWGKSVEAEPKGVITLELPKHNEAYTWTNPTCCVHNIIVGQLWIEQYGNVEVINHNKKKLCAIYGKWTECLYAVEPAAFEAHRKADKKSAEEKKSKVIPGSELIWRNSPRPDNSAQFYAFSTFAMQLNEVDKAMEEVMPSTDCRLRPDIRAMENGDIDLSSGEKKRLEEKQRTARKNRSKSSDDWKNQGPNPHNKAQDWLYSKGYWERNYSQLPNIY
ncbi:hypothetical protein CRUP_021266 [Coryphaenoides rupestris]|nr:hypothetical protein CRUP_021266 [Coryphaenoides rupestris]